jgi:hypothetical protein
MSFRSLHDDLLEYNGQATFDEVLRPWLEKSMVEVEWLRSIRQRTGQQIPAMPAEELWDLYAVSRAIELLALGFQTGLADGSDWPGPAIPEDEFARFAQLVGLDVARPRQYSSFHHEIVGLSVAADAAQPAQLLRYHWPCLMLGPLLFMRAGVTVSSGCSVMARGIADKSTLYWTYRRKTRPHQDLAHGWGSNSSWRTSFRRDYLLDGTFHFNVDGDVDLFKLRKGALNDEGLSLEERKELVANRCFVVTTKDHADQFPYHDRFSVKAE